MLAQECAVVVMVVVVVVVVVVVMVVVLVDAVVVAVTPPPPSPPPPFWGRDVSPAPFVLLVFPVEAIVVVADPGVAVVAVVVFNILVNTVLPPLPAGVLRT